MKKLRKILDRFLDRIFGRGWGDRKPDEIPIAVTTVCSHDALIIEGPISILEEWWIQSAWEKGWRPIDWYEHQRVKKMANYVPSAKCSPSPAS